LDVRDAARQLYAVPFVIIGPRSQVSLDGADEPLLEELPRRYGLRTPRCDYLWANFYGDPCLTTVEEVCALRDELLMLRMAHAHAQGDLLARARKVFARDEMVRARILERLLQDDPVLRKCDEMVALCHEAIAAGVGLACSSD
jgi:hypothetical protein